PVQAALPRHQRPALVPAVGSPLFPVEHDDTVRRGTERALRRVDQLPPIREMAADLHIQTRKGAGGDSRYNYNSEAVFHGTLHRHPALAIS
ncbi:MAG: hypothetical protein KBC90_14750, partial [Spirochaetes bacterium]|nr:hypothetical protein [Spirochaetota bacterium]